MADRALVCNLAEPARRVESSAIANGHEGTCMTVVVFLLLLLGAVPIALVLALTAMWYIQASIK